MFFNLSHQKNSTQKWPHVIPLTSKFFLETDEGWRDLKNESFRVIYKGYLEFKDLKEELKKITIPAPIKGPGNFMAFLVHNDESISILHPEERTTPLFYQQNPDFTQLTNLSRNSGHQELMRDEHLQITPDGQAVIQNFLTCESPPILQKTEHEVIQELNSYLDKKICHFFKHHSDRDFWLFHSKGADTSTLYAYILKNNLNVKIIQNEHKENTYFYKNFKEELNATWNYRQIHHWQRPSILVSGAHGDEMLLRNPLTGALILSMVGVDPFSLLNKNPETYNGQYLLRKKNRHLLKRGRRRGRIKSFFKTLDRNDIYDVLKFYMLDDYQHWHLGNTLTYTPFKDIHLFRILLQAPVDLWKKQFTDAYINKKMIEMNAPEVLEKMSRGKNRD